MRESENLARVGCSFNREFTTGIGGLNVPLQYLNVKLRSFGGSERNFECFCMFVKYYLAAINSTNKDIRQVQMCVHNRLLYFPPSHTLNTKKELRTNTKQNIIGEIFFYYFFAIFM